MAATVHSILEITYSIYSVADQVKANKRRCKRLCERLRVLDAPLQRLATNPQRAAAEESTLHSTLGVVTEARDLVYKYTAAKWYDRWYGAALGGHRDEFDAINERLRHCIEALQIDIAVDLFDAKHDATDKKLDSQQMVNLLEHFVGEQDRTRDVVLELKELIKDLAPRDTPPPTTLREIDPTEVVEGDLLGRGSFGEVRAGTWAGVSVAIKKLPPLLSVDTKTLGELRHEATTHQQLTHPNILAFFGACISPPHRACLVVELAPGGSLYERIHVKQHTISPALALAFAIDIVAGLSHLHRCSIFHRDLKSPNVLIAVAGVLKLADFGLARVKSVNETLSRRPASCKYIGTVAWMAPELHDDEDTKRPAWDKVDIYALGIILSELASRKIPWEGKKAMAIARAVLEKKRRPEISADERARHRILVDVAEGCWAHQPADRLSVVDGSVQHRLAAALGVLGGDPRKEESLSRRAHETAGRVSADTGATSATRMVNTPRFEDPREREPVPAAVSSPVVADTSMQDEPVRAQQNQKDPENGHHPETGDIAKLVSHLNTGTDKAKERTALVLGTLTTKEKARSLILKAGGIAPLIKLLNTGTDAAKTYATGALGNLSVGEDEAVEISKEGGIPALVKIAKSGNSAAKGHAALALHNFVVDPDWPSYRRLVVDAGGIVALVDLANAANETTQERAAIALYSLTDETNYRRYIAESGGINALEKVLGTGTTRAKRVAGRALSRLTPLKGALFVGAEVEAKYKGGTSSVFPGYYPGVIAADNGDGTWVVKFDNGGRDNRVKADMIRIRKDALCVGAMVEAKWKGGPHYYPGVIAGANSDDTWDVQYDDGDRDGSVPADMIRIRKDALCVGARVEAKWKGGPHYYPGVIKGANSDGTWDVQYDDGDRDGSIPADMIRPPKAALYVGAKVKATWQGGPFYYPGVIAGANADGTWDVKYDDGDRDSRVATNCIRLVR